MKFTKFDISPEYPRIPHLCKEISNMTHDDILPDMPVKFPIECFVGEKIDGSNCGVSWFEDGPILRNRKHILSKGYSKIRTPAKQQFQSTWNWIHKHEKDIKLVSNLWESPITIFGDWMFAKHSIEYNRIPDWFIAYDIWSVEDNKYLSPKIVEDLLSKTSINYIKSELVTLLSIDDVVSLSELPSDYRNDVREGIVIKTTSGNFVKESYKVVNKYFVRSNNFNDELIKNKLFILK